MAVEPVVLTKPTRLDKARHFSKSVSRQSPDATATLAETTSRDPGSRLLFACMGTEGQTYNGRIVIRGSSNGRAPKQPKARAGLIGTIRPGGFVPVVVLLWWSLSLGQAELEYSNPGVVDSKVKQAKAKASLAEYTEGAKYRVPSAFELNVVAFDYILLGDYADADKWLTRALQSTPEDTEGWYYLGRTKYNENRFEEAIKAFQRCLKTDPASLRAQYNLGLAYQGLGRTEDAAAAFRTAIAWQQHKLNQDPEPFIDLGSLMLDENQSQDALPYLLRAVAISPQEFRAHEQLGRAFEHLDQLQKAQTEFEKAVALAPQNARLHYVLGQVYRKEGLAEKAKLEFDRSSALRRDSPSEGHNESH